jgi:hypothetical protein
MAQKDRFSPEAIETSWLLSGSNPSAPEKIFRPEMATRRERKIWVLQDALPRTSSDSIVTLDASAMHSAWPAKPLASSVPPRPPVAASSRIMVSSDYVWE